MEIIITTISWFRLGKTQSNFNNSAGYKPCVHVYVQAFVYGEFVLLYSCFHTQRERHRSQNCNNDGTQLLTSGSVRYEAVLHSCRTSPRGDGY